MRNILVAMFALVLFVGCGPGTTHPDGEWIILPQAVIDDFHGLEITVNIGEDNPGAQVYNSTGNAITITMTKGDDQLVNYFDSKTILSGAIIDNETMETLEDDLICIKLWRFKNYIDAYIHQETPDANACFQVVDDDLKLVGNEEEMYPFDVTLPVVFAGGADCHYIGLYDKNDVTKQYDTVLSCQKSTYSEDLSLVKLTPTENTETTEYAVSEYLTDPPQLELGITNSESIISVTESLNADDIYGLISCRYSITDVVDEWSIGEYEKCTGWILTIDVKNNSYFIENGVILGYEDDPN